MSALELEWVDVEASTLQQLRSAQHIRERRDPTQAQHDAELAAGWPGSDGASNSPDTIWGMRIGRTGIDFAPELPAYCHDLDYRAIRRMVALGEIGEEEAEELRQYADEMLLLRIVRKAAGGAFLLRAPRAERGISYYQGVRIGGASSARPRAGEAYPRLAPPRAA